MDIQEEYTVEVPATITYKIKAFSRMQAMHIVLDTCASDLEEELCITQEGYDNMVINGYKRPYSDAHQKVLNEIQEIDDWAEFENFCEIEEHVGYDRACELTGR